MMRWSYPKAWSCRMRLVPNSTMDGVLRRSDGRTAHLFIGQSYSSPEVVEWPALVSEIGEECERKPQRQMSLHRLGSGLLRNLINGCECPVPKLRHAESHAEQK
jgi:hypothetical protein